MTPQELRDAALQEVGVLAAGEESEPADAALVTGWYLSLYNMLAQKGLVSWAYDEDIPPNCDRPVLWMLSHLICGAFDIKPEKAAQLAQLGALDLPSPSLGERQLRSQMAADYVSWPATAEYF